MVVIECSKWNIRSKSATFCGKMLHIAENDDAQKEKTKRKQTVQIKMKRLNCFEYLDANDYNFDTIFFLFGGISALFQTSIENVFHYCMRLAFTLRSDWRDQSSLMWCKHFFSVPLQYLAFLAATIWFLAIIYYDKKKRKKGAIERRWEVNAALLILRLFAID